MPGPGLARPLAMLDHRRDQVQDPRVHLCPLLVAKGQRWGSGCRLGRSGQPWVDVETASKPAASHAETFNLVGHAATLLPPHRLQQPLQPPLAGLSEFACQTIPLGPEITNYGL